MPTTTPVRKKGAGFSLRPAAFHSLVQSLGLDNDQALGDAMGLDKVSVWRVRTGRHNPGAEFVSKFLALRPDLRFEDAFSCWRRDDA